MCTQLDGSFSMWTRIVYALGAAGVLIGSGLWYAIRTRRRFEKTFRSDDLRAMQADGTLPAELRDANLDIMPLTGFGMQVSSSELRRIWFADLLQSLWWIWIPAVLAVCVIAAALIGNSSSAA